jgi:hypothetical protein
MLCQTRSPCAPLFCTAWRWQRSGVVFAQRPVYQQLERTAAATAGGRTGAMRVAYMSPRYGDWCVLGLAMGVLVVLLGCRGVFVGCTRGASRVFICFAVQGFEAGGAGGHRRPCGWVRIPGGVRGAHCPVGLPEIPLPNCSHTA